MRHLHFCGVAEFRSLHRTAQLLCLSHFLIFSATTDVTKYYVISSVVVIHLYLSFLM